MYYLSGSETNYVDLHECVVSHSKRSTNSVADALAKLAPPYGHKVMTDKFPLPVRDLVKGDSDSMFDA
jgi:hypothetical protein